MTRNLNALSLLAGLMGLGALAVSEADLVGLPGWGRTLAIIAAVGLLLWQKLPDEDHDGTPDVFEGLWPWLRSRLPWLGLLGAFLWLPGVGGCGGIEAPEVTDWEVAIVGDPQPDYVESQVVLEWSTFTVAAELDQGLVAPYTSQLCIDVLSDRVLIFRACGSCDYDGGTSCVLSREPVTVGDE